MQQTQEQDQIIGQDDIKEFVDNALDLTINILFNGSPGTDITLHLQRIKERLPNAFSNTSAAAP